MKSRYARVRIDEESKITLGELTSQESKSDLSDGIFSPKVKE